VTAVKSSNAIAGAKKGKDGNAAGDDDSDPIEESLKLRIKAGGITEVVASDKKAAGSKATA